jgi:hypothetical protein
MKEEELYNFMRIKKGELPRTRFVDYNNTLQVTMEDFPDESRMLRKFVDNDMTPFFRDYASTLSEEEIRKEAIESFSGNKFNNSAMESTWFSFTVYGLDSHNIQAALRRRLGIVYCQQSGAVCDYRHADVMIPRSFAKFPDLLERYKQLALDSKQLYADLLDTGDISIADARLVTVKTSSPIWLKMHMNLLTLIDIMKKRQCSQEESINLNEMCRQIKQLVINKFPYFEVLFKSDCDMGRCFHQQKGFKSNCIYKRDKLHSIEGYEDKFTLHNKTKDELSAGPTIIEEEYIGDKRI